MSALLVHVGPAVNEYLQSLRGDEHIINQSSPIQLKFKIDYVRP